MADQRITYLFNRYFRKQSTLQEREAFLAIVEEPANKVEVQQVMEESWAGFIPQNNLFSEADRDMMLSTILPAPKEVKMRFWPRIAVAASIILITSLGTLFYIEQHPVHKQEQQVKTKNDVAPGHHGATLTLANGKKIRLTDAANGELAEEAGVKIRKTQNGQLVYEIQEIAANNASTNTLSTENGENYQVKLPDGSLVWLNSASSLTYKASLNENGKRMVKLTGEGYFEIARDKRHPFIVHTATQEVEVLGTHFNINSYKDEPAVATTLLEGSVKVTSGSRQQIIRPGYQVLNTSHSLKIEKANTENITDWKDGDFNLDGVDFRIAMRKIARWYNVDVIYDPALPENMEAGGWISRTNNLSAVLKAIEQSGQVHFKVEGRNVYVFK